MSYISTIKVLLNEWSKGYVFCTQNKIYHSHIMYLKSDKYYRNVSNIQVIYLMWYNDSHNLYTIVYEILVFILFEN